MKASQRQTQHERKFKKILKVAARLFAKKGYEKVSIEEIAWRLKLTKGSLYHYFKSKEEVLFLIQMEAVEFGISAQNTVLSSEAPAAGKLAEAVRTHISIITREEVAGALKQQELILPPPMRARVIEARDRYEEIFAAIIRQGVSEGAFHTEDVKLGARATLGMLNGITKWYSPRGARSLDEIAEAYTRFIIRAFTGEGAEKLPGTGPPLSLREARQKRA